MTRLALAWSRSEEEAQMVAERRAAGTQRWEGADCLARPGNAIFDQIRTRDGSVRVEHRN